MTAEAGMPPMIFLDYKHEACDGEGCEACNWNGLVGECVSGSEAAPEIKQILACLPFTGDMQTAKRESRMTLRELSSATGIPPSRLSEIEHAHTEPSEQEKSAIRNALGMSWQ